MRLLLVSNRLPITVREVDGAPTVTPSTGGLATGLAGPHRRSDGVWIGWPGELGVWSAERRRAVFAQLEAMRLAPLQLTADELKGYYQGFSNRVLWPLFHYLLDHIPLGAMEWQQYRAVNRRFADQVAEHYRDGDRIWVHDYHLCLVPAFLRERLPDARIGFFLHIPFPAPDVLQALPWRDALLRGLLGADLIGFHTFGYQRHFADALRQLLQLPADDDGVELEGRRVRLGTFPMGVDVASFEHAARDERVLREASALRAPGGVLLLGVDRLDYTKGIRRRMLGFERLLELKPEMKRHVRLVQIAVPSRADIDEYEEFRGDVDEVVGRINGEHGDASWQPIHYLCRGFSQAELTAFYRAADVMLVTPLRDGMNLVAKEFIASRVDERGVLLLSELAGASAELPQALSVNPYDVDGIAHALSRAIGMSNEEQAERMRALRHRVAQADVHQWTETFLDALDQQVLPRVRARPRVTPKPVLVRSLRRWVIAPRRRLLLDWDGTLVPFTQRPENARGDEALRALLVRLSALPHTQVDVVTGRPRADMEARLEGLPVGVWAEHGAWHRSGPQAPWVPHVDVEAQGAWKAAARRVLDRYGVRTPGSFVEEKSASLAWHYRGAQAGLGRLHALELAERLLREDIGEVDVLDGDFVLELRARGVSKALALTANAPEPFELVLAFGDDRTDEDLFAALRREDFAVHVGPRESIAPLRVESPEEARALLVELAFAVEERSTWSATRGV